MDARMNKDNYVSVLNIMNQIEDYDLINTFKYYTVNEARLKPCHTKKFYILEVQKYTYLDILHYIICLPIY